MRFLIHVSTNWCGMDDTVRAIADNEEDLYDLAEQLAYDNFESYNLWEEIDESNYYGYSIEEFTGDDEEWKEYAGMIYE